jgi:uncharacterized protein YkwD/uncharacterized membrane protein required for colicin V production
VEAGPTKKRINGEKEMNTPSLNGNYVDLIIVLVLAYFASEALRHGFWVILADFFAFLGSLLVSLRAYKFSASFLKTNFSLPHSIANALGFLVTAILAEAILGYVFAHVIALLPKKLWNNKLSKYLAVAPAVGEGIILVAFLLTLAVGFPIKPSIKQDINDSRIGSLILTKTSKIEKAINEVFGGVIEDSLTYLTIKPGSREVVPLSIEKQDLSIDEVSEEEMVALINEERKERGLNELTLSAEIVAVARSHARDMWERKYFGHVSPEGYDVGDRLDQAKVTYTYAAENLALAPTVTTAHNGLMGSPGHRENILDPRYKKVGVGVIDNGVYGKMFVENFSD